MTQTAEKTYTLRCTYLAETSEVTGKTADDLDDTTLYIDVDSEMRKWSGDGFRSAWGAIGAGSPLRWDNGEAWETNILREGLNASGKNLETFEFCNELLAEAGKPLLQMLDEDGEPFEHITGVDWDETFDTDGKNKESLELLDEAHWELIEE